MIDTACILQIKYFRISYLKLVRINKSIQKSLCDFILDFLVFLTVLFFCFFDSFIFFAKSIFKILWLICFVFHTYCIPSFYLWIFLLDFYFLPFTCNSIFSFWVFFHFLFIPFHLVYFILSLLNAPPFLSLYFASLLLYSFLSAIIFRSLFFLLSFIYSFIYWDFFFLFIYSLGFCPNFKNAIFSFSLCSFYFLCVSICLFLCSFVSFFSLSPYLVLSVSSNPLLFMFYISQDPLLCNYLSILHHLLSGVFFISLTLSFFFLTYFFFSIFLSAIPVIFSLIPTTLLLDKKMSLADKKELTY